jgi:hypothetical protein
MLRKGLEIKYIGTALKTIGALLFASFYLVGANQLDSFHKTFHPQESYVDHSAKAEQDGCHRTLYHAEKNDGCKHNSHFVNFDKCTLCNHFFQSDHVVPNTSLSKYTNLKTAVAFALSGGFHADISNLLPSRAPPLS